MSLASKAPAVDPETRAYTLHSGRQDWPARRRRGPVAAYPLATPLQQVAGLHQVQRTFLTALLPCPGATLVSERAGFGAGTPSLTILDVDRPELGSQGCRRTNRVALSRHPRGFHALCVD